MSNNFISFPATEVKQRIGTFYIASLSAFDLVRISYADVRRIEQRDVEKYLGIQRPLDESRVRKIKTYLMSPDASFPTGIVLSVDQRCAEFDGANLILRPFQSDFSDEPSIPFERIAKILDGQHRIAAFVNSDSKFDHELMSRLGGEFYFNANIFIGLDVDEQANIFATVNLAQTKVNKSLVYDLEGLSNSRNPFKSCHQIAVALDSGDSRSPLYLRIKRLGVKTQGRSVLEPLTQATFVESLLKLISINPIQDRIDLLSGRKLPLALSDTLAKVPFRNLFVEGKDMDIAVIIHNYFTAVKERWPKAWDGLAIQGNILPRSNAFKAFMRYLRKVYTDLVGGDFGRIPSSKDFYEVFEKIQATDEDFTSGNFKPGSGGEASFYKLLLGEVSISELKSI